MGEYQKLLARRDALELALAKAYESEVGSVIASICELMDEYHLTGDDIAAEAATPRAASSPARKVRKVSARGNGR